MPQKILADTEEIGLGGDATDLLQKLPVRIDAKSEIVHVLLHPLHLRQFPDVGGANGLIQGVDIIEHLESDGSMKGFPSLLLAELVAKRWMGARAVMGIRFLRAVVVPRIVREVIQVPYWSAVNRQQHEEFQR